PINPEASVLTLPLPKHRRQSRSGKLGLPGSAGGSEVGAGKHRKTRVKQYLGIPFARPPVGPLRLAAPQDVEPWEGERDGTKQPPMCIQDPEIIVNVSRTMSLQFSPPELSEDCLYLNVYAPAQATTSDKLAVS
uniref:Carboxylesterase type B domain-containing protein n=1 Tax=Stegastes partitus TaxID=144197 RepID=A0A3B5AVX4_9TELE